MSTNDPRDPSTANADGKSVKTRAPLLSPSQKVLGMQSIVTHEIAIITIVAYMLGMSFLMFMNNDMLKLMLMISFTALLFAALTTALLMRILFVARGGTLTTSGVFALQLL